MMFKPEGGKLGFKDQSPFGLFVAWYEKKYFLLSFKNDNDKKAHLSKMQKLLVTYMKLFAETPNLVLQRCLPVWTSYIVNGIVNWFH